MYRQRSMAAPRLAREGFLPAGPEKRITKRAMLIPKTGHCSDHLPTVIVPPASLTTPERRALREVVETAEVVREDGHAYLVARVSSATLDSLAAFETEREDMEEDGSDESSIGSAGFYEVDAELDTSDDEPDHDDEYDYRHAPHVASQESRS